MRRSAARSLSLGLRPEPPERPSMGLVLGAATAAEAQLSMQMSNGWSFTFAGNVNAFAIYESTSEDGTTGSPGTLVGVDQKGFNIRTGLLPAFAVFGAKKKSKVPSQLAGSTQQRRKDLGQVVVGSRLVIPLRATAFFG